VERKMITHRGGCHCGAVAFEVDAPAELEALECNCSICTKSGYLHLIVPATRFRLLHGRQHLATYQFGTRTAKHFFCTRCGIKSFYIPRSNPEGYSVNVRCLEPSTIAGVTVERFDGQNWEENAHRLMARQRQ
jgi:centromere protein V